MKVSDEELLSTTDASEQDNTTRLVRDEPREWTRKRMNQNLGRLRDYWIIWVHKNIVKVDGIDLLLLYCWHRHNADRRKAATRNVSLASR